MWMMIQTWSTKTCELRLLLLLANIWFEVLVVPKSTSPPPCSWVIWNHRLVCCSVTVCHCSSRTCLDGFVPQAVSFSSHHHLFPGLSQPSSVHWKRVHSRYLQYKVVKIGDWNLLLPIITYSVSRLYDQFRQWTSRIIQLNAYSLGKIICWEPTKRNCKKRRVQYLRHSSSITAKTKAYFAFKFH